jgi:pilus assembly protein CpaB
MRVGRLLIVLSILVILGLVAVYAVLQLNAPSGGTETDNTIDIVIALQPIPRGSVIVPEQLGLLAYPADQTIEGMVTNIGDAVGKRARYDLTQGTPINTGMLVDSASDVAETVSDTALLIPAGMVAFPIPIDRFSSLAYGLRAGDHVNVIATMLIVDLDGNFQTELPNNTAALVAAGDTVVSGVEGVDESSTSLTIDPLIEVLTSQVISGGSNAPQGQALTDTLTAQTFYVVPSEEHQRPRLVSQTLLQDIVILHVGNFLYTDTDGNEVPPASTAIDASGNAVPASASPPDLITLIVTPQDAVTLNYLVYAGAELNLALRSGGDDSIVTTEAVTLEYLLTTYDIPVPTKLPYGLEPRINTLVSPTQQDILPQLPQ